MTDATPIHCEMCGNETQDYLRGTFGVMCAACVKQVSGHPLAELVAIDPMAVPLRPLTAEEQDAILQSTMASIRYGPRAEGPRVAKEDDRL